MRNMPASTRRTVALSLCVFLLIVPTGYAFPAETKAAEKAPVTTLHVPTTGTILDVTYMPDFQEWWVKCREGDKIVVYSYERLIKSWRKMVFEVKKPETMPAAKKPEQTQPGSTPAAVEHMEAPKKEESRPTAVKTETKQEEAPPAKKKWWEPILNIIKQR